MVPFQKGTMRTKLFLFLQFTALLGAATTAPDPSVCAAATLDVSKGWARCRGSLQGFIFKNFSFETLFALNGHKGNGASAVVVTASAIGADLTLKFPSTGFSLSGFELVQYLIAYTIDPLPP